MSERGRFIVDRCVFEEPLLRDPEQFRAWLWLVSEAAWQPQYHGLEWKGGSGSAASTGPAQLLTDLHGQGLECLRQADCRTILRRFETGSLIGTNRHASDHYNDL